MGPELLFGGLFNLENNINKLHFFEKKYFLDLLELNFFILLLLFSFIYRYLSLFKKFINT